MGLAFLAKNPGTVCRVISSFPLESLVIWNRPCDLVKACISLDLAPVASARRNVVLYAKILRGILVSEMFWSTNGGNRNCLRTRSISNLGRVRELRGRSISSLEIRSPISTLSLRAGLTCLSTDRTAARWTLTVEGMQPLLKIDRRYSAMLDSVASNGFHPLLWQKLTKLSHCPPYVLEVVTLWGRLASSITGSATPLDRSMLVMDSSLLEEAAGIFPTDPG